MSRAPRPTLVFIAILIRANLHFSPSFDISEAAKPDEEYGLLDYPPLLDCARELVEEGKRIKNSPSFLFHG